MTTMTTTNRVALDPLALQELQRTFHGELVSPESAQYDQHRRIWNAAIDRRPALIARCAGPDDVVAALRLARRSELSVAVRSGGHSFPGHSLVDDGVIIDLSLLKHVDVNPKDLTVRVGAGVRLGELDQATQPF